MIPEMPSSSSNVAYYKSLKAVREQSMRVFNHVDAGHSASLALHLERLPQVAELIVSLMKRDYGVTEDGFVNTEAIPPHSRWRHYSEEAIEGLLETVQGDGNEQCRVLLDLFVVSVLMDAGAGPQWSFRDPKDGRVHSRSEGLAMAVLRMFEGGAFSSAGSAKLTVTAEGTSRLLLQDLQQAFQVSGSNEIVGLEGRLALLHNLANVLQDPNNSGIFPNRRPSDVLDYLLKKHGASIPLDALWAIVANVLDRVWPESRTKIDGVPIGDAWRHKGLGITVPFHKLPQWLTYSLIEPIETLATVHGSSIKFTGTDELTGLPEYRNGGLFIDTGVIEVKGSKGVYQIDDELVVEWRALTVVLLDLLADKIKGHPAVNPQKAPQLTLPVILEAGTWKAGRELSRQKRADGSPPIDIVTDGTVF